MESLLTSTVNGIKYNTLFIFIQMNVKKDLSVTSKFPLQYHLTVQKVLNRFFSPFVLRKEHYPKDRQTDREKERDRYSEREERERERERERSEGETERGGGGTGEEIVKLVKLLFYFFFLVSPAYLFLVLFLFFSSLYFLSICVHIIDLVNVFCKTYCFYAPPVS